jgi:hypothetical protein
VSLLSWSSTVAVPQAIAPDSESDKEREAQCRPQAAADTPRRCLPSRTLRAVKPQPPIATRKSQRQRPTVVHAQAQNGFPENTHHRRVPRNSAQLAECRVLAVQRRSRVVLPNGVGREDEPGLVLSAVR